jgi:hypothetical protein
MTPRHRSIAALLATAAALALSACGEKDEPSPATTTPAQASDWAGPPATTLGELEVDAFNAYADEVDERWERSALLTAAEFARLDREQAATTSAVARTPPEGGSAARVTITLDGLLDDSIRATRLIVELERKSGTWRLVSAAREQRCHEGRGHSGFEAKRCL